MGGLRIDAKDLPLPMREQVAEKIVAQIREATPVAGRKERTLPIKVPVRKLQLRKAVSRYRILKDAVREGVISDLRMEELSDRLLIFRYRVQWAGEFIPTSIPASTLQLWRTFVTVFGKGKEMLEPVDRGT